jgi:ABC-type multidrug transport system fused ATPase/permease subunit
MIFLFLTSGVALIFPALLGDLVDSATSADLSRINEIALILMVVLMAQSVFSFFRIYLFAQVTENSLGDLRKELYAHLIRLPMTFFSSRRVGELNSRISADVSMLADTFNTSLAEFIRQIILIIGGIIFLTFLSPHLTLIMLAVVPVVALLAIFFGRKIRKISRETQDRLADSNTIVEETIQGISNVKSFANELFEIGRYKKGIAGVVQQAIKGAVARGMFAAFIIMCLFGSIVLVIWQGVGLVQEGTITTGQMFKFLLYSVFVGASIGGIAELYAGLQRALGATERIFEIMDEAAEKTDPTPDHSVKLEGEVEFKCCFCLPLQTRAHGFKKYFPQSQKRSDHCDCRPKWKRKINHCSTFNEVL